MATHVFPTVNDVNAGTAGLGKTLTEANIRKLMSVPYHGKPYVKSGAAGSNAGSLNLNVALGVYCIEGMYVEKTATETVALTAASTCRVWLQLVKDGSGNVTDTQWVVRTDATVPSGEPAVLTHIVVTGASTITTITDTFRGIISPGGLIAYGTPLTTTSSGTGDKLSLAVPGDAQTDVRIDVVGSGMRTSAAGNQTTIQVRNGSGGTGTAYGTTAGHSSNANETLPIAMSVPIDAYATASTFYAYMAATSGTPSFDASATAPGQIRASWDF